MTKKVKKEKDNSDNFFLIPLEKKKKILGFLLLLVALFLFLSVLSYRSSDYANLTYRFTDLFKIFSDDVEFLARVENTKNWLGIFGAYTSSILIASTIGYFSIVFPLVLFVWGYQVIKEHNYKLAAHISNIIIAAGVLAASFFGLLQAELNIFPETIELSGKIGFFLGSGVGRLLGGLGGILFFAAAYLILAYILFENIIVSFVKSFFEFLKNTFRDEPETEKPVQTDSPSEKEIQPVISVKRDEPEIRKEENRPTIINILNEQPDSLPVKDRDNISGADDLPAIKVIKRHKEEAIVEHVDNDYDVPEEKISADDTDDFFDDDTAENITSLPEQWEETLDYTPPKLEDLQKDPLDNYRIPEEELRNNAKLLKEKLALFDIGIQDISITPGPVVTMYELVPEPGVKISKIVSLENDIALALAARGIRIIAPIPGKSAIGVEIPNNISATVSARSVLGKIRESKAILPLAVGKTIAGDIFFADLASMPHLLVAGSTGSGKSVGINMMIMSLLYSKHPVDLKFVIIDPKKVELSFYKKLSHHFLAVSPDINEEIITTTQNALVVLQALLREMEMRYIMLSKAQVRNTVEYNTKAGDPSRAPKNTDGVVHHKLPYVVVVIDELADLMITSGKEVEEPITRLAQLARAVGIHLILATQRPSVNVITGIIKANFSARIAYQVATKIDSRTILDINGAERLLGKGDMLFLTGKDPKPIRMQNAFVSTDEVEKITEYIFKQRGFSKRYYLPSMYETQGGDDGILDDKDELFVDAAKVVVRTQQASVTFLQRKLKIGYARSARIMEQLVAAGIVGQGEGSKPRDIYYNNEDDLADLLRTL